MPTEPTQSPLFASLAPESAPALAASLAPAASTGHYDELRGAESGTADDQDDHRDAIKNVASDQALTPAWASFFENLGLDGFTDLDRRQTMLARQIKDNGVTYNVYADAAGPQRPWSLDLFPLIIPPHSWSQIEAGVLQRMQVLNAVMADVYGPQLLLSKALLPAALVQGHPGYLRAMHGVAPVGGIHLHIAAFDLARGPDGNWWGVSHRTQAPSGLGYLLENRLSVSRLFPQAFESMHIQRLAGTYRALVESLQKRCALAMGISGDVHIALLTPGPYSETYFEHAYLARYLGLTLVEGSDLTVRDQRLYLRTLQGLEPVHAVIKRLDDEFLDPLELRSDSTLGVPGLLQAIRAGHVLVANAPGSAFLESTALLGFLPALARELIGEELLLPALPTWWCGERAAMQEVLPMLGDSVIKPTYPGLPGQPAFDAAVGQSLSRSQLDEWAGRIVRRGDEHTVQAYVPLSQMPVWRAPEADPAKGVQATGRQQLGQLGMRSVMLRVFAVAEGTATQGGQAWRVLPGGMARIASADEEIASMQRGGSSADVWVMVDADSGAAVDKTTLLPAGSLGSSGPPRPSVSGTTTHRNRIVTSRAAENLFWLGRYTERCENNVRLARVTLERLNSEDQSSQPLLAWLGSLAVRNSLVSADVPPPTLARRVFERSLIANLAAEGAGGSVGFNLGALQGAASAVRERLSLEQWNEIGRARTGFFASAAASAATHAGQGGYSTLEALGMLESASVHLAAITGSQTDRMTRDDGWRLLSIGRHIERLGFLSDALAQGLQRGATDDEAGFEALLALFDSTITFHGQYQLRRDLGPLLDLLVCNADNPRSLGWVAQSLRGRLSKLAVHTAGNAPQALSPLAASVPAPADADLAELLRPAEPGQSQSQTQSQGADDAGQSPSQNQGESTGAAGSPQYPALMVLLAQCSEAAWRVSDEISVRYFTHSGEAKRSVGA